MRQCFTYHQYHSFTLTFDLEVKYFTWEFYECETWVLVLYNHIPNIINPYKKAKCCCTDTKTLNKYQLFYLKVKGQIEVTMEHDTPTHDYTPAYQISLIYRKRQKSYDSDTITLQKYKLFYLEVKGQRQNVVMLVHDTFCLLR
jgi:hypothetical protein